MAGKNNIFVAGTLLVFFFLIRFYIQFPEVFSYRFNPELIERYFRSQDIPHHVSGRVFLSDDEIHMAAGYMYVSGFDPTSYNFQHPPLIKYIYGASTLFFGNPLYAQLLFGLLLVLLTFVGGLLVTKNIWVAFLAGLFLSIDPAFTDLSQHALLDLGQSVFSFAYVLSSIFMPQFFVIHGILLGLFAASKFWSPALFFMGILFCYKIWRKEFSPKYFIGHIGIAAIVFFLIYMQSFIDRAPFNIIFFQLKMLKYWFHHSVSSVPGDASLLFTTGYFHSWWQNKELMRIPEWTLLWPISIVATCVELMRLHKKKLYKKTSPLLLFSIIPLLYLAYISLQAPYTRYFIMILPYCYIIVFHVISLFIAEERKK